MRYKHDTVAFSGNQFDSGEAPSFKPKFTPLTAEQMVRLSTLNDVP